MDAVTHTRREFLARMALVVAATRIARACAISEGPTRPEDFTNHELEVLGSAMDAVIPEGDGIPSATAAGGTEYLRTLGWEYPTIQAELRRFLDILSRTSSAALHAEFDSLHKDQRIEVLKTLEQQEALAFSGFVSYVYEAYYTRPQVLGLVACPSTPVATDDLEKLLARVRRVEYHYREAR